jgi:hypothetical protein
MVGCVLQVADFINRKGRVTLNQIVAESNKLIKLDTDTVAARDEKDDSAGPQLLDEGSVQCKLVSKGKYKD